MIDFREFAGGKLDLDDIEAPWEIARSQGFEPGIGTAFDERLLFLSHGVEAADLAVPAAGFDFDEQEQFPVASDDVHLALARAAEISGKDGAAIRAQPVGRDTFAVVSQPISVV